MTEAFTLPAFAKINLFLHIHGKRDDGYHELCTVFQTISLCDSLSFSDSPDSQIHLTCDDPKIPTGENNLIVRAASLLKKEFNLQKGANIHLVKRIPSPGGLGGGSSDAAAALIGLIKLWQISIDISELTDITSGLGSDVPFFLTGGTALGTGRGTDITPLDDFSGGNLLVITPRVNVSTADAYSLLSAPGLTKEDSKSKLIVCHNEAQKLICEQAELRNDFEGVIFKFKPELAQAKNSLLELKADKVLMSGSGASIFAFFPDENARQNAFSRLNSETDWQVFAVETISREYYRKALLL
jgi:4-diphosphocytidyl-2-C-methyl-D-erythritol kinase